MASQEREVRVGFIGAGYMGTEHVRAFDGLANVRLVGIHDSVKSKAEGLAAKHHIDHVCDSVADLFERAKPDVVVVSVVELSMRTVACACFEYPWTILLEKPAGYHLADAEAIQAAAARKSRQVYVALNRRMYCSTRMVRDDVARIAGPRFITVQDQQDQATALAAGQPADVVKNWMFANSVHTVDYLRVFGRGRVTKVTPIVPYDAAQPWMVVAAVEFDSGDKGVYQGVWRGPGPWAVTVQTREKRWEMRPLENATFQLAGKRVLEPVVIDPRDQQFKAGLRLQAEHMVASVRGQTCECATLTDSLETMRLVQAIFFP